MGRNRRRADHFTRRAKQQNFPARSVFKLEELDRRFGLLRAGDSVLDLGCSPGSWLLYAAGKVGPEGVVVGVDRHSLKIPLPKNGRFLQLDALSLEREAVEGVHQGPFDVVLSDMAPHTSGNRFVDQQRSLRLVERALDLALEYSRPGGAFVGKIFQSEELEGLRERASLHFQKVKVSRPQATRKQSYEVYLICQARLSGERLRGEAGSS